jgi:pre-rRNA-processing protein TSR1
MSNVPVKNQVTVKKSLLSFIQQFFPEQEHLYSLDADSDSVNVIRYLASQRPKPLVWRDLRPYMLADDVEYLSDNEVRRLLGGIQEEY